MEMSEKATLARDYFLRGYNCAQSVFTAFHRDMGLEEDEALRLASSLGGGVGGLREVCGAFLGMSLALGALRGYDRADDADAKKAQYARIQAQAEKFKAEYGTLICRELLESHGITPTAAPMERTPDYYRDRPCARYVETCARLAEEELKK